MKKKVAKLIPGDKLEVDFGKDGKKIETIATIKPDRMIREMVVIVFKSGNWTHENIHTEVETII